MCTSQNSENFVQFLLNVTVTNYFTIFLLNIDVTNLLLVFI